MDLAVVVQTCFSLVLRSSLSVKHAITVVIDTSSVDPLVVVIIHGIIRLSDVISRNSSSFLSYSLVIVYDSITVSEVVVAHVVIVVCDSMILRSYLSSSVVCVVSSSSALVLRSSSSSSSSVVFDLIFDSATCVSSYAYACICSRNCIYCYLL